MQREHGEPVCHVMFWHCLAHNEQPSLDHLSNKQQIDSKQESYGGLQNFGIPRNGDMGTLVMLFVGTTLSPA